MRYTLAILIVISSFLSLNAQVYTPGGTIQGSTGNNNVGIGTNLTTPAEKLHVAGNIQIGSAEPSTTGTFYINMPPGSSTINGGNGRDLVVMAGSSDNSSVARGGHLILRPGVPVSPSITYGNIALADNGGKVGIGTTAPQAFLDVAPYLDATAAPGKLGLFWDGYKRARQLAMEHSWAFVVTGRLQQLSRVKVLHWNITFMELPIAR